MTSNTPLVSELSARIEAKRMTLKMGLVPSELLGASDETWKDRLIIYKGLLDWVRAKNWSLTAGEASEVERTIGEKIPAYGPTRFQTDSE